MTIIENAPTTEPAAEPTGEPTPDALPALLEHRGSDVAVSLEERLRVAEMLAQAGMLPDTYRGKPGNVLAAQFAADALQIPLFTAFQHLHNVKGRVGLSAELMRSLMRRAGHRYSLSCDGKRAVMVLHLRGEAQPKDPVEYTLNHAVQAGLVHIKEGKPWSRSSGGEKLPWEANTDAMLIARVTSKTARMHCPEVLAGMGYTPDELEEAADSQRVTATVTQVPAAAAVKPVAPSDPERMTWTPDDLLLALTKVDPADDNAMATLRRYWTEGKSDGVLDELVDGKPLGKHVLAAQAAVKGGDFYAPLVDAEPIDAEDAEDRA
jgi:hypothetical protein